MDWSSAPEGVLHRIAVFACRDLDSRQTFPFVCKAFCAVWPPFQRTRFPVRENVAMDMTLRGRTLLLQEKGRSWVVDATDGALLFVTNEHLFRPYRMSPNGETLLHMSPTEGLVWFDPRRPSPPKATVSAAQLRELLPKKEPYSVDALSTPGLAKFTYAHNWHVIVDGRDGVAKSVTFTDFVSAVTSTMVVTINPFVIKPPYKLHALHDASRTVREWSSPAFVLCWTPLPTGGVRAIYFEGSNVCEATLDLGSPATVVRRGLHPSCTPASVRKVKFSLDGCFVISSHENYTRVVVRRVTDFGIVAQIDYERDNDKVYSVGANNRVHVFARTCTPHQGMRCNLITFPSIE